MTDTELAWAAGIIDGEGCITCTRQKPGSSGRINPSYRIYLKVTMGHRPTIDRLHTIFQAGSVHIQRSVKHNDAFSWWISSRQAENALRQVYPYLVTKRDEADLAFEFWGLPTGARGGAHGNPPLSPEMLAARERLFVALRDIKPSARFRVVA